MRSQNLKSSATTAVQLARARRISEVEWEKHRENLVKLYVEESTSRKDIIGAMAKEHSFLITDKQLKHRFQKWGVRKYIPDADMNIMLSLKRKRHAEGKDVRFQYKGLDIEQKRIERADKRQKGPLLSPIVIPTCIKAYTPPHHDTREPENSLIPATSPQVPLLDSRTQIADLGWASLKNDSDQGLANFTSNNSSTIYMTDAQDYPFDIPPPQFPEASPGGPVYDYSPAVQPQSLSPIKDLAEQSVREDSFSISDFINFSSVPDSPNWITGGFCM